MKSLLWKKLSVHAQRFIGPKALLIKDLFNNDPERFKKYSGFISCNINNNINNIFIDYSKNAFTDLTFKLWIQFANACGLMQALKELNHGKIVNLSENRPALHHALRKPQHEALPEIREAREKMARIIQAIHCAENKFTDIVNIGIGGSDLGPRMTVLALSGKYSVTSQSIHFISTVDAHHREKVLKNLNLTKTLFIVSSKSFTTQETLINAAYIKQQLGERFIEQMFAVTANQAAAKNFGIAEKNILPLWPWVGGRYSIWSAIGLPLAIKIGMDNFEQFLEGGAEIDDYMLNMPLEKNIIIILALINIWQTSFLGSQTHAVLPYDARLSCLPAYLQQLEMESNGKSVGQDNSFLQTATGPIIWGEIGTNGQHAFHQLLHQGTQIVPVDFILTQRPDHQDSHAHNILVSHCLSQAKILMTGENPGPVYQRLLGNRPSTLILLPALTPKILGNLISLYEYKVFISAVLWGINPFDQWGVEAGKKMALDVYKSLQGKNSDCFDSSTHGLINFFRLN